MLQESAEGVQLPRLELEGFQLDHWVRVGIQPVRPHSNGRVLPIGPCGEVFDHGVDPVVRGLLDAEDALQVRRDDHGPIGG